MINIYDEFLRELTQTTLSLVGEDGFNKEFLFEKRKELITYWKGNVENYLALDKDWRMHQLGRHIIFLSLFNDDEIFNLMESLEISDNVTKYFINLEELFQSVSLFFKESKFDWNSRIIMTFYYPYRGSRIMNEFWLDLGNTQNEMDTILRGLERREKKGKLSVYELNQRGLLEEVLKLSDETNPDTLRPKIEKGLSHGFRKTMNFSHKFLYGNMYQQNLKLNENAITTTKLESDFKVDFFDLSDIIIMDKEVLWGKVTEDEGKFHEKEKRYRAKELEYGDEDNRRFKIKRVEELFINLSENYSI